jgi:hypothetical protein
VSPKAQLILSSPDGYPEPARQSDFRRLRKVLDIAAKPGTSCVPQPWIVESIALHRSFIAWPSLVSPVVVAASKGLGINPERVKRLMLQMGITALARSRGRRDTRASVSVAQPVRALLLRRFVIDRLRWRNVQSCAARPQAFGCMT